MKKLAVCVAALALVLGGVFGGSALAYTVFEEDFDGNGPGFGAWTNISNAGDWTAWYLNGTAPTGDDPINWAGTGNAAEAGAYGWAWDDLLMSPVINASGADNLVFEVNIDWWPYWYDQPNVPMLPMTGIIAAVASDWSTGEILAEYDETMGADYWTTHEVFDLSAWDYTEFQLVFYYNAFNPQGESIGQWQIDDIVVSGVPEPSTILLLGAGIIGLIGLGRKKFKK